MCYNVKSVHGQACNSTIHWIISPSITDNRWACPWVGFKVSLTFNENRHFLIICLLLLFEIEHHYFLYICFFHSLKQSSSSRRGTAWVMQLSVGCVSRTCTWTWLSDVTHSCSCGRGAVGRACPPTPPPTPVKTCKGDTFTACVKSTLADCLIFIMWPTCAHTALVSARESCLSRPVKSQQPHSRCDTDWLVFQ